MSKNEAELLKAQNKFLLDFAEIVMRILPPSLQGELGASVNDYSYKLKVLIDSAKEDVKL